ncbi:hypothetical protein BX070DRAFT_237591 [Coemansia spiralis]|nr:hypothetical protein BX070DRAFT_237591 [Coemansia spiralis]
MNSEYRAPARILSTSTAPVLISECAHDLLVRWPPLALSAIVKGQLANEAQSIFHLGQYVATFRARSARDAKAKRMESMRRNFVDSAAHWVASGISSIVVGRGSGRALDRNTIENIDAVLVAAERVSLEDKDDYSGVLVKAGTLALVGGVVVALVSEAVFDAVVDRAAALYVRLAQAICKQIAGNDGLSVLPNTTGEMQAATIVMLAACIEAVPLLSSSSRFSAHVDQLMRGNDSDASSILVIFSRVLQDIIADQVRSSGHSGYPDTERATALICAFIKAPAISFSSTWQAIQLLHTAALSVLIDKETREKSAGAGSSNSMEDVFALAALHVAEATLQRFFLEDAYQRVPKKDLDHVWCLVIDTMAAVHFTTLKFGREGSEVFRRASTLAMQFLQSRPAINVDSVVRKLFSSQPCLSFMATQPVSYISGARTCLILFYIDLLEHLVPYLSTHTLAHLVVPLASRYADTEGLLVAGPEWFESAHALILAILELVARYDNSNTETVGHRDRAAMVLELVPWYADLLLKLYPDMGISAKLLRIAYTATVRAATTNNWQSNVRLRILPPAHKESRMGSSVDLGQILAWGLVRKLLDYLDNTNGYNGKSRVRAEVEMVRRRELLVVVADLLAAVPFELLPMLMAELRKRLLAESEWATRRAVVDEIQEVILAKADLARKPLLSIWTWQLRADVDKSRHIITEKL